MNAVWIVVCVAAALALLAVLVTYICYRLAFHVIEEKDSGEYPIPHGEIYRPYRDVMVGWIKEARALHREEMYVTSFDGLQLHGSYYEYAPGAPIELMFHGYRGSAERDLCGGIQRCFSLGRSALIVDQRTSGQSGGKVISFGINESRDCRTWVDFAVNRFGPGVKIILTGISMGASTVLMAAGRELPEQVVGVLADCGYHRADEIIRKVIDQIGLPQKLLYPFVKLGARLFGGFDLEEDSPVEAMKRCRIPVVFFHGEADDFVPCEMSRLNYEACAAAKRLYTVPGAGHGMCYLMDPEGYLQTLREFEKEWGL